MNKFLNILNISLVTVAFLSSSQAAEQKILQTSQSLEEDNITEIYETAHPYANNTDETQELSLPDASNLRVTITGEVEQSYDKIFITDSTGNETQYTGVLAEEIIVPGDHITVRFTSDGSVVKEGAVVEISDSNATPPPPPPPVGGDTYETGHPYENNADETQELSIPGSLGLEVTISGEVEENYDKIFITDSLGNETEYTGVLRESFTVAGDHITVRFTSDSSIVKEGATVHIAPSGIVPPPPPVGGDTYETGHPYENNADETQELSIPGSLGLDVTITGEVEENYDKIFITDSLGNEREYTGVLRESFTVGGDHITVRFTSDGSVVKEGAIVHIAPSGIVPSQ